MSIRERVCKQVLISVFWRSYFLQALWNFERMQNVGFAFAVMPVLTAIYPDKEERKAAVLRHMEFFNTNPYMANIIMGLVASMELEMLEDKSTDANSINTIKINTAGPLAAIGDKFFWATWRPFCAVVCTALILFFYRDRGFNGTWLAPIFYLVFYNIFIFPFKYWSLVVGCRFRNKIIKIIAGLEFKYLTDIVRYLGFFSLVVIVFFYMLVFIGSVKMVVLMTLLLAVSIAAVSIRVPPGVMVYFTILLSILFAWLKNK